ncbi:MAG: FkbM family methyltransferase [Idiomarinaceae bacterium HL-53]|nr:MAG: FkbM family methyltransferase [Idiomarinaceae bacterium HL-53]
MSLENAVWDTPLFRQSVAAIPEGSEVLLAGSARAIASALRDSRLKRLRVRGLKAVGTGGRATLHFRDSKIPVVFCGSPHKRWFNGPSEAIARCFWLDGLSEWRQSKGRADSQYLESHIDALSSVYSQLEDDASRLSYAACVRARVSCDAGFYRTAPYPEYFHPLAQARPGNVVIDVGAYTGGSAIAFRRAVSRKGSVIAMEPSPTNFKRLKLTKLLGIHPVCAGASDVRMQSRLREAGGSSTLGAEGTEVELLPIDYLVTSMRLPTVDLIKYDVEGHEMPALLGAKETLERFRPIIQLSIYHHARDLFELPLWVMRNIDNYAFYVSHHNCYHTGTDLYAVPRERLGQV